MIEDIVAIHLHCNFQRLVFSRCREMRAKDIQTHTQTHTRNDYHMPPGLRPPRHKNVGTANLSSALTLQYWSICPLAVFSEHTVWNSIASYGECLVSYLVTKSCCFHLSICFFCSHEQHSFQGLQIFEEKKKFFEGHTSTSIKAKLHFLYLFVL